MYTLCFRSGQVGMATYSDGDNVSLIEISNSDQDYYQNGVIELFDVDREFNIGDTINVYLNVSSNTQQFSGYIARKSSILKGKLFTTYQIIGKTYDLWRYATDNTAMYTGNTSYIVSSLISSYANGVISCPSEYVNVDTGYYINSEIDLRNKTLGDAIITLTDYDGFRFYVDDDSQLRYYEYSPDTKASFSIIESDIVNMTPVEEADEDIVNVCTVKGGSDYSVVTTVSDTHPSYFQYPSGITVAQSFVAEDTVLKAVKLYLGRTTGDYQPNDMGFEIWEGGSGKLYEDDFGGYSFINTGKSTHYDLDTNFYDDTSHISWLTISPSSQWTYSHSCGQSVHSIAGVRKVAATFLCTSNCVPYRVAGFTTRTTLQNNTWFFSIRTDGPKPGGNTPGAILTQTVPHWMQAWTYMYPNYFSADDYDMSRYFSFSQQITLISGNNYYLCFESGDGAGQILFNYGNDTGHITYYFNGSSWVSLGASETISSMAIQLRAYNATGMVQSICSMADCQYMKLDISCLSSAGLLISGTNNSGTTWLPIKCYEYDSSNKWIVFPTEGTTGTYVRYFLSGGGFWTPRLGLASFYIGDAAGSSSGAPASGTKLEWSNDISFSVSDFPYPPSYSAWITYDSPKLANLEIDRTYWMIFKYTPGSHKYWEYYYDPNSSYDGKINYGWNVKNLALWSSNAGDPTDVPAGALTFKLGWTEGDITAEASNPQSINAYGRHYKMIEDSSITSLEQAQALADITVSGSEYIPKKGTITINGRTDISTDYMFSANLTNLGVDELWEIVAYKQRIDRKGFQTSIDYGKHNFDIMKRISDLEVNG